MVYNTTNMEHKYDPFLHARRDALADLVEDLSADEYDIAEKAIDVLLDKIDYIMEHAEKVMRNHETGALTVLVDDCGSN